MPGSLHRYFFYGWLFRDARRGDGWERWSAIRHNQQNCRWLPTYMLRWSLVGMALFGAAKFVEAGLGCPDAAAALYAAAVLVIPFNAVTAICWGCLRFDRVGH